MAEQLSETLQSIYQNLEFAVEGIVSGKCKSEGVVYIEEAMEELFKIIIKLKADK